MSSGTRERFWDIRQKIDTDTVDVPTAEVPTHIAKVLRESLSLEAVLLALVDDGRVLNVYFDARDPALAFPLGTPRRIAAEDLEHSAPYFSNTGGKLLVGSQEFAKVVSFPLRFQGRVTAILELIDPDSEFGEADLELAGVLMGAYAHFFAALRETVQFETTKQSLTRKISTFQERLELLVTDSPDGILTIDVEGVIHFANIAAKMLFGLEKDSDLSLRHFQDFLLNPADFDTMLRIALKMRPVRDFELIINRGQEQRYTTASLTPRYENGAQFSQCYLVLRDITTRVLQNQQLLKANMELWELNEKWQAGQLTMVQQEKMASIGVLAAGVAHEINNPLGFVSSNFSVLQEEATKCIDDLDALARTSPGSLESEAVQERARKRLGSVLEILGESRSGLERIIAIVRSLRAFSRIDHDGDEAAVDINEALKATISVARNEYRYVADLETDFSALVDVHCNANQINQVFLNLIVNAAQAIRSMKRSQMGKITVVTSNTDKDVFIHVIDDGPGMNEDVKRRIFEPFFTTKEPGEGTGLGLSISHDIIVHKHQGSIDVKSLPGKGSEFIVRLPIHRHNRQDSTS